jgi:hypothetical protein
MPYATVTQTPAVSTSPGATDPVALNWIGGKPTTVGLSWNSSNVLCISKIQYTLDDIQRVSSQNVVWNSVPSTANSSNPQFYGSTTYWDTGVTVSFLNPIAAVRLNSTSITAGSSQSVTMKVLQGEGF